jgi:hypothetical protein
MNDPLKKRPWFQFSLLTAFVMMLAASGLVELNLIDRDTGEAAILLRNCIYNGPCDTVRDPRCPFHVYGWPFTAFSSGSLIVYSAFGFNGIQLAADIVIGLAIIFASGCVAGCLVRRQYRKRPLKQEGRQITAHSRWFQFSLTTAIVVLLLCKPTFFKNLNQYEFGFPLVFCSIEWGNFHWCILHLIRNINFALALLAIIAVVYEYLVRGNDRLRKQREARKP